MERWALAEHFRREATRARDAAQAVVVEQLPEAVRFHVVLNAPKYDYFDDDELGEDEDDEDDETFPEDSSLERAKQLSACDEETVISALWRDGKVPQWVLLVVMGEDGATTFVEVICSGYFTERDELLRYNGQPFHARATRPPYDHDAAEQKFSLHTHAHCHSLRDLEYLRAHPATLRAIWMSGEAFTDDVLARLPELPKLDELRLLGCALHGAGLGELVRFPLLSILDIEMGEVAPERASDDFSLPALPEPLLALGSLGLQNLPSGRDVGLARFLQSTPALFSLSLRGKGTIVLDGTIPESVRSFELSGQRAVGTAKLPPKLAMLRLCLAEAHDADLVPLLADVLHVDEIVLRGSRASDALIEQQAQRFGLRYLNVEDTDVSEAALKRIKASRPKLRVVSSY